ncbi:hypothetical protein TRFO_28784 [Tritrichomonas foetus]|uniref:Uncharacterized protein n=1 Tax=Tritrichomonas foetus TaxID=1144522 RepID=A0A1J4K2B0_9EUKA|nr:hypothetical protein TRFO_28784 [Tritrichomonas foetus]|eukprot:OHT03884.1 hypothetical protein TRFO_28784 [Tritrichomonas foetus]
MALAIVGGVIAAVKGGLQIAAAFRKTTQTTVIGTVTPQGFSNYYGYSSIAQKSMSIRSVDEYLNRLITRIEKNVVTELQIHKQDIIDDLTDIKDFESYAFDECSNLVNTVQYNNVQGVLYFYVYKFDPFVHSSLGDAVRCFTMQMLARIEMPRPYMIVNKVKSSFFKVTSSTEIQYLPAEGIQYNDVIEAIAIAFAPAALGIVQLPDSFLKIMQSAAERELSNKTVYPNVTPEMQKLINDQFESAIARQKEQDEETMKGLDTLAGILQSGVPEASDK